MSVAHVPSDPTETRRPPIRSPSFRLYPSDPFPRPVKRVAIGQNRHRRSFGTEALTDAEAMELKDDIAELTADGRWTPPADFDDPTCVEVRTDVSAEQCGWARCRFSLIGTFSPDRGGSYSLNHPSKDVSELKETCALRFAVRQAAKKAAGEQERAPLREIAEALGVSIQRVHQDLTSALAKVMAAGANDET